MGILLALLYTIAQFKDVSRSVTGEISNRNDFRTETVNHIQYFVDLKKHIGG